MIIVHAQYPTLNEKTSNLQDAVIEAMTRYLTAHGLPGDKFMELVGWVRAGDIDSYQVIDEDAGSKEINDKLCNAAMNLESDISELARGLEWLKTATIPADPPAEFSDPDRQDDEDAPSPYGDLP